MSQPMSQSLQVKGSMRFDSQNGEDGGHEVLPGKLSVGAGMTQQVDDTGEGKIDIWIRSFQMTFLRHKEIAQLNQRTR